METQSPWYINKYMDPSNDEQRLKDAVNSIESNYGCSIQGVFPLNKVSGSIHVSYHSYVNVYFQLKLRHPTEFLKVNLSYEIVDLHFGHELENYKARNVKEILSKMDLAEVLFENYVDHENHHYDNFIGAFWMELIPYKLIDHTSGLEFKSLQHSFNRKIKVD